MELAEDLKKLITMQILFPLEHLTGSNATAKVTVSAGTISAVTIMDGGSAYGIGNTMHITGITTSGTGHTPAVVEVQAIYNNVGDVIRVAGVSSESYAGYNDLYRITSWCRIRQGI